jgi:hypothetical protein
MAGAIQPKRPGSSPKGCSPSIHIPIVARKFSFTTEKPLEGHSLRRRTRDSTASFWGCVFFVACAIPRPPSLSQASRPLKPRHVRTHTHTQTHRYTCASGSGNVPVCPVTPTNHIEGPFGNSHVDTQPRPPRPHRFPDQFGRHVAVGTRRTDHLLPLAASLPAIDVDVHEGGGEQVVVHPKDGAAAGRGPFFFGRSPWQTDVPTSVGSGYAVEFPRPGVRDRHRDPRRPGERARTRPHRCRRE